MTRKSPREIKRICEQIFPSQEMPQMKNEIKLDSIVRVKQNPESPDTLQFAGIEGVVIQLGLAYGNPEKDTKWCQIVFNGEYCCEILYSDLILIK